MSHGVRRAESLGSQIADVLRTRIVRGELVAGERLTEEALAEEFQVSRGPVRDAITQLTSELLVQVKRPRGIYIVGLSEADVEQLYSLRAALEKLALEGAMRVEGDERWAAMWDSVEVMARAAQSGDHAAFAEADLRFHTEIYALADNPRLEAVWRLYAPTFSALLEVTINHDHDLTDSAHDHRRLFDIMRSGDAARAVEVLEAHLEGAHARMVAELSER